MKDKINKFLSYMGLDGLSTIVLSSIFMIILNLLFSSIMSSIIVLVIFSGKELWKKFISKDEFNKKIILSSLIGIVIGFL